MPVKVHPSIPNPSILPNVIELVEVWKCTPLTPILPGSFPFSILGQVAWLFLIYSSGSRSSHCQCRFHRHALCFTYALSESLFLSSPQSLFIAAGHLPMVCCAFSGVGDPSDLCTLPDRKRIALSRFLRGLQVQVNQNDPDTPIKRFKVKEYSPLAPKDRFFETKDNGKNSVYVRLAPASGLFGMTKKLRWFFRNISEPRVSI